MSQRPTPKHKQDSPSGQAPKSTAKEPTPQDRRRLRYEAAVAGSRLLGPLQRCSRGKSEMVDMDLVIAGNGKPKKLTFASRGWTGTPAARCIEKLIRLKYRMKPFEQKTYAYRWELFIRQ